MLYEVITDASAGEMIVRMVSNLQGTGVFDEVHLSASDPNSFRFYDKFDLSARVRDAHLRPKYAEELGRWNDLIAVLMRRAQVSEADENERVENLRRVRNNFV